MRLLAVSGSLRANSSNTIALQAAVRLAPDGVDIELFGGIADLPYFNQDLDTDAPPATVQIWRRAVEDSDGLIVCSPEYAAGISGVMKNALDWLGGGMALYKKPVAVINASPRAYHADDSIRLILSTMAARVVAEASISLPLLGGNLDATGIVANESLAAPLRNALAAFVTGITNAGGPQR